MSVSAVDSKSIHAINPGGVSNNPSGSVSDRGGPSFRETLQGQVASLDRAATQVDKALAAKAEAVKPATLKFSNHAVERMNQRGIVFSPDQIAKIEAAARKAAD